MKKNDRQFLAGIDLGGTDIKFALLDRDGTILSRDKCPTQSNRGPRHVAGKMAECLEALLVKKGARKSNVRAVGIGVPGPLNSHTGILYDPPNLGWGRINLKTITERAIGLPCTLENDANAAAYGEFWKGAGKRTGSFLLYTLGTGIGGGIILDGRLYRGSREVAGELGHVTVYPKGLRCNCGNRGCLEAHASATAIRKIVKRALRQKKRTSLRKIEVPPARIEPRDVFLEAQKGDTFSKKIFENVGEALGIAAASMVNALNPDMIAYSGGMIGAWDLIYPALQKEVERRTFELTRKHLKIRVAQLGEDAGVIGAAGLALSGMTNEKGV